MQRTDRVYAGVCLSADGAHMAIGGRDKRARCSTCVASRSARTKALGQRHECGKGEEGRIFDAVGGRRTTSCTQREVVRPALKRIWRHRATLTLLEGKTCLASKYIVRSCTATAKWHVGDLRRRDAIENRSFVGSATSPPTTPLRRSGSLTAQGRPGPLRVDRQRPAAYRSRDVSTTGTTAARHRDSARQAYLVASREAKRPRCMVYGMFVYANGRRAAILGQPAYEGVSALLLCDVGEVATQSELTLLLRTRVAGADARPRGRLPSKARARRATLGQHWRRR